MENCEATEAPPAWKNLQPLIFQNIASSSTLTEPWAPGFLLLDLRNLPGSFAAFLGRMYRARISGTH